MNQEENYIEINKQSWNNRLASHLESEFYDVEGFLKGNSSLNDIELELLGDVKGKSILHLQCHFGQDTISLARLGAEVTGVDLSDKAILAAKDLVKKTNQEASFICCDIFDMPSHLDKEFDIIYTSYGTIGWLPDLDIWAKIISRFLKPGGKFVFVEFHPVVWMFDDDFEKITYSYSNSGAMLESESGTYAAKNADIQQEYVMWNHGLGEVVSSLIKNNLGIMSMKEYDYSPYNCFNHTIEFEPKKFRIEKLGSNIPMVYSLVAKKTHA